MTYPMVTKTFLKPTYLPTYATVVKAMSIVKIVTHNFFHPKLIFTKKKITKKLFFSKILFSPKISKTQIVTKSKL